MVDEIVVAETWEKKERLTKAERRMQRWQSKPVPATRADADAIFRPFAPMVRARANRLARLNALGLLEIRSQPGQPITQGEAHDATLDALYPVQPTTVD